MGVLGKDLFDFQRSRAKVKVQFGENSYWVEDCPEPQPYGKTLTEFLNLDLAPIEQQLEDFAQKIENRESAAAFESRKKLSRLFSSLPLYRLYRKGEAVFESFGLHELFAGEALEAYEEMLFEGESDLQREVRKSIQEIKQIQSRYTWFLDELFREAKFEKKKGQKKIPLATLLIQNNLEALVSGSSLGESPKVDAPAVNIQYAVIEPQGQPPELVEKLYFDSLLDFAYVELMKGMQKGFIPKRCANCGKWFLQLPGASFNYCDNPVPGAEGKTCREIGAASNFKDKVKNNEVWQIHQRAYKKYFARTRKKTMGCAEFEAWSREAERLRDAALKEYSAAVTETERIEVAEQLRVRLNQK